MPASPSSAARAVARREAAVALLGEGMHPRDIARAIGVHPSMVYRWVRGLPRPPRGPQPSVAAAREARRIVREALDEGATMLEAAQLAGVSLGAVYLWHGGDPCR